MNNLYPLKFKPIFKEKIWGGGKIHSVLKYGSAPVSNCGEAWLLSSFDENDTIIKNGFLKGNSLGDIIEIYMDELVGDSVYNEFENTFPLLIKAIDANEWLSVQVHPNDDYAERNDMYNGKTEMWYIADAKENSQLIAGFNKKINSDIYNKHLNNGNITDILEYKNVKKGDVIFIPAGVVHAIGPDILLFEIQQASDATYRIYDYNRKDKNGNLRELHTKQALEVINFDENNSFVKSTDNIKNTYELIVNDKHFAVVYNNLGTRIVKDYTDIDSFVILLCTEGNISICDNNNYKETVNFGELVLIPANITEVEMESKGEASFLEIFYPNK